MEVLNAIVRKYKQKGLIGLFRFCMCKLLGIDKQQEEINCLYYYINQNLDITKLSPTDDEGLRQLQLCDVTLMNVIHRFCKQNYITYWLDYGTLLGAVRHKGFIPWDDDTDISMPREDYERFKKLAPEALGRLGFKVEEEMGRIGIGYQHEKTAIWCDVFPAYAVYSDNELSEIYDDLKQQKERYCRAFQKNQSSSDAVIDKLREEYFSDYRKGKNKYYILEMESCNATCFIHPESFIQPLGTANFENFEFQVPGNTDRYLKGIYGNYMSFPHGGILHHGEATGRPPLGDWARLHGLDMNAIRKELEDLGEKI